MEDLTAEQLSRAADRVREMHRRAGSFNQNRNSPTNQQPQAPPPQKNIALRPTNKLLQMLNFKNFDINPDTGLLLGIIFLLTSEGADELLILALIYIML